MEKLSKTDASSIFDWMEIRKMRYNEERYFSVVDIAAILAWSIAKDKWWYRRKLKQRLSEEWSEVVTECHELKLLARDWKSYPTDCANTQTLLRIIQSIPSPKAEPFKQWLAQIGNERIEEYNDPELGIHRARERAISTYQKKWMSEKEIKMRMSSIGTRHNLTDVWKWANIDTKEYGMLTNLWYSWTGLDAEKMRKLKWLTKSDALRDHFSKPEILLTELAEETALRLTEKRWSKWFVEVQQDVIAWSDVAKKTKEHMEDVLWEDVVTWFNRLSERQKQWRGNTISLGQKKKKK